MSVPTGYLFISTSSQSARRACLVSSRLLYPRHVRWICLDAFSRSRSCCLLRRSAAARAVASCVLDVAWECANWLDARPDRLICRDLREWPVKVWCIMSARECRTFGALVFETTSIYSPQGWLSKKVGEGRSPMSDSRLADS